jgi:PHP family Zn ribbon phosphoesterase
MSNWKYDSGGHKRDMQKFNDNFDKIFTAEWPCPKCGGTRQKGHKEDCENHWKNKK